MGKELSHICRLKSVVFAGIERRMGKVFLDKQEFLVVIFPISLQGVLGCAKSFNTINMWRKGITLLAYLYGYSIAYSFFRGELRHG